MEFHQCTPEWIVDKVNHKVTIDGCDFKSNIQPPKQYLNNMKREINPTTKDGLHTFVSKEFDKYPYYNMGGSLH